jgi:hypothetical protein
MIGLVREHVAEALSANARIASSARSVRTRGTSVVVTTTGDRSSVIDRLTVLEVDGFTDSMSRASSQFVDEGTRRAKCRVAPARN